MKISKIKTMAALSAVAMLLGGCGEAPYQLTESEEDVIVNYSAHVVSKFNTDQKQGLTYVNMDAVEEAEQVQEPEIPEETENVADAGVDMTAVSGETESTTAQAAGLNDIFGSETISVTYTGASLTPNYIEDAYYSVDAEKGKTYLVLGFDITNNGAEDAEIDNFALAPVFRVNTADGVNTAAEFTVLLEDFSTYQGTIPAGETQRTVLLFQVPDTVTEVPEFTLNVNIGGTSYQIAL